MNKRALKQIASSLFVLAVTGMSVCLLQARPDEKMAPAELVAKHLESIGPADARARGKGTRAKGTVVLSVRQGGSGQDSGQAVLGSQGSQNILTLFFDASNTKAWLKFDGHNSDVSHYRPGTRTALENFFAAHETIIKEGLVGGTLSESWPLLNLQEKNPKIEYAGLKKVSGKQLHALRYLPRKGSDLKITLYFEPETFRHVRTQYERTIYATEQRRIAGGGGSLPSVQSQSATAARILAYEEFSDFKPESGLNLPHTYKFELHIQSETRPALVDWIITLTDFSFNTPLSSQDVGGGN